MALRKIGKGDTEVSYVKSKLIEVLKILGCYSPAFDTLITSCAQLTVLRDRVFDKAFSTSPLVEEVSRENDKRKKSNPVYELYIKYSNELRNVLNELTLSVKSSTIAQGDALDELNRLLEECVESYEDA